MNSLFKTALEKNKYVADVGLSTSLFLALKMNKAIFLEGEPGVGKTEVAKVLSRAFNSPLIRLQCYEGLDINQAVYEWNYPRQLLEIQARHLHGNGKEPTTDNIFSEKYLIYANESVSLAIVTGLQHQMVTFVYSGRFA